MFTDTVGYTASAQADEAGALGLLRHQEELVRPLFAAHQGREIKSTGDGFLVEFDSALMATQCAVDIQRRMYERNAQSGLVPIEIRIGIHLGDVEQHGADIFGDAVNIAARIQRVAEPGGICVSGAVYEQVRNKIPDKLERIPPTALKGVHAPIDIYRVVLPWAVREPPSVSSGPRRLAVLPFTNISPDPKDEYFADGLTEEIISVLSQLRELRVIARTSVSQYKSTSKTLSQIGNELGVEVVLEGSVRKAGDELRITAQLIRTDTQEHTWANTYDRKLEKVFAVQTEIARQVAEALKVELRAAEEDRLKARPILRPDSYLAYLKGRTLENLSDRNSLEAAQEQFELAISLDARNAAAHCGLADTLRTLNWWHPDALPPGWDEKSRRLVARAVELDPNLAEARVSRGLVLMDSFEYVAAEKELQLALALNPSYSLAHAFYGTILEDEGRADEALTELALAEAADPLSPFDTFQLARILVWLKKLDEALVKIQKLGRLQPSERWYPWVLAEYHLARSNLEGCLEALHQAEESSEPRWKSFYRALSYALSGQKEQSRAILRHEESLPEFRPTITDIALVYAELGDIDDCFRWLEKGVQLHHLPFQAFRLNPRLEHIRADPRFQALLKKMNLA